jgi:hypothetical protein
MNHLRRQSARFSAIAAILLLYGLSLPPQLPPAARAELAAQFSFAPTALPVMSGFETQVIRDVHPDLAHIAAWFSGSGAAVALNDLDGDGLPNDTCYVDIRIDQVIVAPAPGTPARYAPFTLDLTAVPYDERAMAPVGCIPNDMNEDGKMDLLVYYWGRTPVAFLNIAGPTAGPEALSNAGYRAVDFDPSGEVWWTNAATFSDLDGDGHADLIIANYFQDNRGLLGANGGPATAAEESLSRAFNGGGTHIYLWQEATADDDPSVHFVEVKDVLDHDVNFAWTLAVGAVDLNGDMLPEIYFANDYGPDRLLLNQSTPGELRFSLLEGEKFLTTPKSHVLGHDSFKGMGIDFGDLNGDGYFDMFVSNIAAEFSFMESHFLWLSTGEQARMTEGIAPYVESSDAFGVARSSWSWETRLADFNNDGVLEALQATGFMKGEIDRWPELQELGLGNDGLTHYPAAWPTFGSGDELNGHAHNPFYVRTDPTDLQTSRFVDIAVELGLDQPFVSRGIGTADVDGDGDLDYAVANQWDDSYFFRNDCPNCGAFLGLHLLLPVGETQATLIRPGHPGADTVGRPSIGATVTVHLPDGRRLINFIDGGNGQAGARSSDLHFGLDSVGPATPVTVDLHWRDNQGQVQQQTVELTPGWHTVLLGE